MTVQPAPKHFLPNFRRSATDVFAPVQREFNRVLEEFGAGWSAITDLEHAPRMDVVETKDAVELTVELPGMADADIKIAVEDDVLTISGEKTAEKEVKAEAYRLAERSYGAFSRSITLPRSVDPEKVTATMTNGVLTVTAPKDGNGAAKTIEIQAAK
jgi:HSP20 family protein